MRPWTRRFWWTVEGVAFAIVIAPFFVIPADAAVRAFAAVGRWGLPLAPAARRIRENLAMVRPSLQPRRITREVGDNFGRVLAEYIRMPDFAARSERRHARGVEHLRQAAAAGRGVVVVSAHFGNWEAVRLAARDAGVDVGILYRAFNNPLFDAMSIWRIRAAGEPVLHKGRQGGRGLLGALKRGGVVMVLLDQRSGGDPLIAFLGREAETATAVAALAQRTGAALIPAFAQRRADGLSFDVTFEPPLPPGDPISVTGAINDRFSAWVDAAPGQWFWLHHRWKRRKVRAR